MTKFMFFPILACAGMLLLGSPKASGEADTAIRGRVVFEGKVPAARKLIINKDPDLCGHGYREIEDVRVDENGGLRDVVVYLDSDKLTFTWNHPEEGYTLNQEGCRFVPYVQIFPKDTKARLRIVNSDPTLHNVRISQILGRVKPTLLNLAQPSGMKPREKALRWKKGSNIVEIRCDAHDFMEGWMFAADNPYCTLVTEDGGYIIAGLPAGEHTFKAWHPYLGTLSHTATVVDGKPVELNFTFTEKVSE
jgi:hypothetical protein